MEEQNNEENKEDVTNISNSQIKDKERKLHTRICPRCKQEYKTKIGVDNWKNLFRAPTLDEWITLIILILLIGAAYAYTTETKICRDTLANLDTVCMQRQANITNSVINNIDYTYNESNALEVNNNLSNVSS